MPSQFQSAGPNFPPLFLCGFIQFVTPWRAEFCPVIIDTLDGEQTLIAYAFRNLQPPAESFSIAGVWYISFKGYFLGRPSLSAINGTEVSIAPISSTRNIIILGCTLALRIFDKNSAQKRKVKKKIFCIFFIKANF